MKRLMMAGAVAAMMMAGTAWADDAAPGAATTPAATKTAPAAAKADAPAATGDWKVDGKTCKKLENRDCSDPSESFAVADGQVYAWTKVTGPKDGGEIHHVWFKGDEQESDITLKIGGSPWRTNSKKTLGDKSAGDWRVEVRDDKGAVLSTLKFTVK